jgi:hypothetical protein
MEGQRLQRLRLASEGLEPRVLRERAQLRVLDEAVEGLGLHEL